MSASPTTEISSPTRARQRIQGTGDQDAYINNHSVVSLLNDLLVSVVEHKPEDVLTFLVDYLTQLQTDVTRARQILERKNRGTGVASEKDTSIKKDVDQAAPVAAAAVVREREASMGSQRPTAVKRLIEVRVDGEVRMIPDVEEDEIEDLHTKQAESVQSVSRALSGVTLKGVDDTTPSHSATLIVQEPTAVRFLLKAAERQKTPFLSMLVDHARTKAAALSADAVTDLSHKSPLSMSTVISSGGDAQLRAPQSQSRPRRSSPAVVSYLGIELLQRSSSGDQFPSLSLLNNHWMVRRQIVIAVEENGEVSRSYSPVPPEARIDEVGLAIRTASSPSHISASPTSPAQQSHRAILVQDPTPIRLLLKAAERQLTPSLSILIDFARKRYGGNGTSPHTSSSKDAGSAALTSISGSVTNANMLGIELLHRSHAHCSGLKALGVLSNHWMVRRQIVVAVKPKENSTAEEGGNVQ